MKLTGKLKTQVESAATKEEKREAIKQAGMLLTDDEFDKVALSDDDMEKVAGGGWSSRSHKPEVGNSD